MSATAMMRRMRPKEGGLGAPAGTPAGVDSVGRSLMSLLDRDLFELGLGPHGGAGFFGLADGFDLIRRDLGGAAAARF